MASIKMIALWAFLVVLVAAVNAAPRYFVLDDGEVDAPHQLVRVRRDDKYVAAASGGGSYGKGHVGPVYTFVKTDPKANFNCEIKSKEKKEIGGALNVERKTKPTEVALVVLTLVILADAYPAEYPRLVVSNGQMEAPQHVRITRDDKFPSPAGKGYKGRVGPVYTFVKTDPKANFKWGVRHRAGSQYGRTVV
uniref:Uncharacterized protein n=1 Tax=Daphnia galeata TaxID=27404 RepID=A0A8J2RD16_9CRUS|nr:unnamed protein product [Daphnia galeata]